MCVCVCVCVFDRHMKKRRGGDAKNSERACARKREIRERGSLLGTVLNNGGSRASPGTEELGAGRVGECTGWGQSTSDYTPTHTHTHTHTNTNYFDIYCLFAQVGEDIDPRVEV